MSTTSDTQISDWSQKVKDMDQTGTIEHDPDINIWRAEQEIMEQAEQSELGASGGVRPRTFTLKGREFSEEQVAKCFYSVKKLSTNMIQMLANKDPTEHIRIEYIDWMQGYELFMNLHNKHLQKLKENEQEEYLSHHHQRETYLLNTKSAIQDYFRSAQVIKQQESVNMENKSVKSDSRSSISSKRLEAEEERIELEARKQAMKRKREIEMAKTALKMEEEELDIETDIAVADAKSKVYDHLEQAGEINITPVKVEFETEQLKRKGTLQNTEYIELNPKERDFVSTKPKVNHNLNFPLLDLQSDRTMKEPTHDYIYNLYEEPSHFIEQKTQATCIEAMIKPLRKPTPEVMRFDGNPLNYQRFLRQFHAKVVINCDNDYEKMNYLEQLTYGEANRVVSGYSHLSGERAYDASMMALKDRYGDTDVIASAFIKKALEWPTVRNTDTQLLDEFALFLVECQNGTECIQAGSILEYSENIKRLLSKLPFHLHDRWRNVVFRIKDSQKTVKFKDFVDFVKAEAKKANDPTYGKSAMNYSQRDQKPQDMNQRRQQRKSGTAHAACEVQVPRTYMYLPESKCSYCETDTHTLDNCKRMMTLSRDNRIVYLKGKGHCYGCLKRGHMSNMCKKKSTCAVCSRQHPTILHNYNLTNSSTHGDSINDRGKTMSKKYVPSNVCSSTSTLEGAGDMSCAMAIIPVRVKLKNKSQTIETYAFFDSGSSVSFCSEKLMHDLGAVGKRTQISINTMGISQTLNTFSVNGLQVSGLSMEYLVDMPKVFTKEEMPVTNEHIPKQQEIKKWAHLTGINVPDIDSDISIMIGNNVPDAYSPFELATGPSSSPHATKTRLGWIIWNVLRDRTSFEVNRVFVESVNDETQMKMLTESINLDFPERLIEDKRENSIEDKIFMDQVSSSLYMDEGHCSIALPFRNKDVMLPSNSQQCLQRLNSLKGKLQRTQLSGTIILNL